MFFIPSSPMVKIGKRDSNTSADVGGLWAGPENLFKKGSDFGCFFESSWVKQLRGVGFIYLYMKEDFCLWPMILHIVFFCFGHAHQIYSDFFGPKILSNGLMCISNFPQVSWYIICINQYIVYTLIFIIVIFVCNYNMYKTYDYWKSFRCLSTTSCHAHRRVVDPSVSIQCRILPNVQSPKSKNPNGKRWNKDGETDVFEKKFAQKKIYHLYDFMSQEVTPTLGVNAHPTLPIAAHLFEAVWQIPPCVLPWAVLRRGYVTSRKVGRFNCHFFSKIQLFFLGGEGWFIFFKTVITVHLYWIFIYIYTSYINYLYIYVKMHLWNHIICVSCKRCRHVQM